MGQSLVAVCHFGSSLILLSTASHGLAVGGEHGSGDRGGLPPALLLAVLVGGILLGCCGAWLFLRPVRQPAVVKGHGKGRQSVVLRALIRFIRKRRRIAILPQPSAPANSSDFKRGRASQSKGHLRQAGKATPGRTSHQPWNPPPKSLTRLTLWIRPSIGRVWPMTCEQHWKRAWVTQRRFGTSSSWHARCGTLLWPAQKGEGPRRGRRNSARDLSAVDLSSVEIFRTVCFRRVGAVPSTPGSPGPPLPAVSTLPCSDPMGSDCCAG